MSSTNVVNFSLRQNKAIERSIVFDGIRLIADRVRLSDVVYVGFGSVWFSDFHLAHRTLDITTMISIEWDRVTYTRAAYNKPYKTVEVVHGSSEEVIPGLLERPELQGRPWVVWLDYDSILDSPKLDELADMVRTLPDDSFLLTTYGARPGSYGKTEQRLERMRTLFGPSAPELPDDALILNPEVPPHLAESTERYLQAVASRSARRGGYVPCFRLTYDDLTPMVTVGGFLPSTNESQAGSQEITNDVAWMGRLTETIDTAPLTPKEVTALQAILPSDATLTAADVKALGFELLDQHIAAFQRHYLRFPTFSQIQR